MNIIYYTCNTHLPKIDNLCRETLSKIAIPIISVSLNKSIDFGDKQSLTHHRLGDKQIVVKGKRSPLMMHKQIVTGLEASDSEYVFLAESDVLYHPSHFDFKPQRNDVYYFNVNVWKMRWSDGFCIKTDNSQQVSGMIADRKLLLDFYRARASEIEKNGFDRHYEPRNAPRINYQSRHPNICIRHDGNLTKSKWSVNDFRNKEYAKGWKESYAVPGWDIKQLLNSAN